MTDKNLINEITNSLADVRHGINAEDILKIREKIIWIMYQMPCNDLWEKECLHRAHKHTLYKLKFIV